MSSKVNKDQFIVMIVKEIINQTQGSLQWHTDLHLGAGPSVDPEMEQSHLAWVYLSLCEVGVSSQNHTSLQMLTNSCILEWLIMHINMD